MNGKKAVAPPSVSSIITTKPTLLILLRFNCNEEELVQDPLNLVALQNTVRASDGLEGREAALLRLTSHPPPSFGTALGKGHEVRSIQSGYASRHALRLSPTAVGNDEVHGPRVLVEEASRQGARAFAGVEEESPPASVRRQAGEVHSVVFIAVDVKFVIYQTLGGEGCRCGAADGFVPVHDEHEPRVEV